MFAVTIDLDAYDNLPPRQLKAMLRALRFADEEGVVHASLSMLAMPGLSRSTAHRELAGLEDAGHIARQERPEGGFLWRIGRRFRCRAQSDARQAIISGDEPRPMQPSSPRGEHLPFHQKGSDRTFSRDDFRRPAVGTNSPKGEPCAGARFRQMDISIPPDGRAVASMPATDGTPVPQRGTADSPVPARLELSSGSKEPSERELSLEQDEIPFGWEAAAAAERKLAGLGPVNLPCEWRKLVAYSEGARITIWRWRGWALKARGDGNPSAGASDLSAVEKIGSTAQPISALPGDERQQRQARDWAARGFWLRNGSWGPAPDQAGCNLPAALVAWCLAERAALAA